MVKGSSNSDADGDLKMLAQLDRVIWIIVVLGLALPGLAVWVLWNSIAPKFTSTPQLPGLLAAPSIEEQKKLIAAIKAHPNPSLTTESLPPLGSDARDLGLLLSALSKGAEREGVTSYTKFLSDDRANMESTYLLIEVAGNPPRVIRRRVETHYDP